MCHAIVVFGHHTLLDDVSHGMPECPMGRKHRQTTSGVACHHRHGQQTRSDYVACGMLSLPLDRKHGQTTTGWHALIYLGVHTRSKNVERVMLSTYLGFTHGRMTSGMACPHVSWAAKTAGGRLERHAVIALGQHIR